jgi:hypothetical protein
MSFASTDKQSLIKWEEFLDNIRNSTPIDPNQTDEERSKHKAWLEKKGNEEHWFKFFFPNFCFCEPAHFQIKSTLKFLAAKRLYQRRAWARGLAKTTRRMFELMYKKFVHKLKINMLLISKNEDNAIRLLSPYRANLEANQRLTLYYGQQQKIGGKWSEEEFHTKDGSSFRAVGVGQNPRGAKLNELRINVLCFDDVDDDEVCENEERLDKLWKWVERAAIPTVEMSRDYYILFDNNIIGEDSIAKRAEEFANDVETVNWRDENGKSTWQQKNREEDIDDMESFISWESAQAEGYNNPMSQGKTFKEMKYGKVPPLGSLPYVVSYADPATSNKDKPGIKSKAKNSCKVTVLLGYQEGIFYLYKCFNEHTSNANFIDGLYAIRDYVKGKTELYSFIENNTLQDPFYQQVLLPLIFEKAKKEQIDPLLITPDDRVKGEKWVRVEANLEPLVRLGLLVLNENEKNDPHMKRLEKQFTSAKPTSKELGGPDATEGAVFIVKQKNVFIGSKGIKTYKRQHNDKRY